MKNLYYSFLAKITGKNTANTPKEVVIDQLTEMRPLPIGLTEFHEWSDRIIAGAMLPADPESQKFALANDLMHCPPNMAYETDVYFIHRLRKYAINQVADQVRNDLKAARVAKAEAEKASNEKLAEVQSIH